MIKRIAAAAALTGAALTMTAAAASAAPMPHPVASAGDVFAPPHMSPPVDPPKGNQDMSIYPGATKQIDNGLKQTNQLGQAAKAFEALDPVLGLVRPVTSLLPM
ncbi:hypothetical protein [Streptomyces sp. NPDC002537]